MTQEITDLQFDPEVDAQILKDTAADHPEANQATADDMVPVQNIDDFARFVSAWHTAKVAALEHLLKAPEGVGFIIGDTEELVLEGPAHAGFLFGVELALMQFKDLPFVAEFDEAPAIQ